MPCVPPRKAFTSQHVGTQKASSWANINCHSHEMFKPAYYFSIMYHIFDHLCIGRMTGQIDVKHTFASRYVTIKSYNQKSLKPNGQMPILSSVQTVRLQYSTWLLRTRRIWNGALPASKWLSIYWDNSSFPCQKFAIISLRISKWRIHYCCMLNGDRHYKNALYLLR